MAEARLTSEDRKRLVGLVQEYEWRLSSKDEEHFFRHYWHIKHPSQGKILFDLRPAQVEGLQHWRKHRYSLTLKARQIGWSTLVGAHAFWLAWFFPDREIIFISRTEREAVKLLEKVRYGYDNLPEWMKERGPKLLTDHQQKMPFDNGSSIVSMPSASDPARGSSAYLVVVDEWAFLNDGEAAWASIEPVANVGGRIIGLSTANGVDNFFYELWSSAEAGEPPGARFATLFMPWWAGGRDEAWYEEQKRSMTEWQLAQEYPSNPEEAFIKSGRPVFDSKMLARFETVTPKIGRLYDPYAGAAA